MQALCVICDGTLMISEGTEKTEIIKCPSCQTRLEVVHIDTAAQTVELKEAPKVEEDWGE